MEKEKIMYETMKWLGEAEVDLAKARMTIVEKAGKNPLDPELNWLLVLITSALHVTHCIWEYIVNRTCRERGNLK